MYVKRSYRVNEQERVKNETDVRLIFKRGAFMIKKIVLALAIVYSSTSAMAVIADDSKQSSGDSNSSNQTSSDNNSGDNSDKLSLGLDTKDSDTTHFSEDELKAFVDARETEFKKLEAEIAEDKQSFDVAEAGHTETLKAGNEKFDSIESEIQASEADLAKHATERSSDYVANSGAKVASLENEISNVKTEYHGTESSSNGSSSSNGIITAQAVSTHTLQAPEIDGGLTIQVLAMVSGLGLMLKKKKIG